MKKIREVQPLVDKLKKKYSNDKVAFSKAQAELYKQKGINPASGCIFQIIQIVILIAFYQVFASSLANNTTSIAKLNNLLYAPLKIEAQSTLNTKFLYLDISKTDVFKVPGIPFALPGLFIVLAAVAQLLSVKVTSPVIKKEETLAKTTKGGADDMQLAMSSSMMYTIPLMTLYFGYKFPSGLALYWLVFSIGTVWQQVMINGWGGLTPAINLLKSKLKFKKEQ
jgi:YidC/Oxa1 family membrane protein insertase